MSKTERNFKGIWIPADLWVTQEFTSQEKIMLAEIDSLDNSKGCFASNAYFAEFFGLSERRVREVISALVKKGAITTRQTRQARIIRVADSFRLRWRTPAKQGGGNLPPDNKEVHNKEDMPSAGVKEQEVSDSQPKTEGAQECAPRKLVKPNIPEQAMKMAGWIADNVDGYMQTKDLAPKLRDKTIARWANDIDKAHRIDGREWKDLESVLDWALNDDFWSKNIRSGHKFREKYEDLYIKSLPAKSAKPNGPSVWI